MFIGQFKFVTHFSVYNTERVLKYKKVIKINFYLQLSYELLLFFLSVRFMLLPFWFKS